MEAHATKLGNQTGLFIGAFEVSFMNSSFSALLSPICWWQGRRSRGTKFADNEIKSTCNSSLGAFVIGCGKQSISVN
jgi:hypothetical protein